MNVGPQPRSRSIVLLALLGGLLSCLLAPVRAHAQPYASFQRAQDAWARGEYDRVIRLLEPLVGGEIPSRVIRGDTVLVRESRKYLGAAYVLSGEEGNGAEQFEALLRAEGDQLEEYELEAAVFPSEVHAVFDRIRDRLMQERQRWIDRQQEREQQQTARRRAALLDLVTLAEQVEVEVEHDPLLAWVPFGAGQFQNGNEGLGWFFAVTEVASLGLSALSFSLFSGLAVLSERGDPNVSVGIVDAMLGTYIGSTAAFVTLAIAGIIEAHVNFVPSHTVRQERPLPGSVLRDLDLAVGPGSASLRLTFW